MLQTCEPTARGGEAEASPIDVPAETETTTPTAVSPARESSQKLTTTLVWDEDQAMFVGGKLAERMLVVIEEIRTEFCWETNASRTTAEWDGAQRRFVGGTFKERVELQLGKHHEELRAKAAILKARGPSQEFPTKPVWDEELGEVIGGTAREQLDFLRERHRNGGFKEKDPVAQPEVPEIPSAGKPLELVSPVDMSARTTHQSISRDTSGLASFPLHPPTAVCSATEVSILPQEEVCTSKGLVLAPMVVPSTVYAQSFDIMSLAAAPRTEVPNGINNLPQEANAPTTPEERNPYVQNEVPSALCPVSNTSYQADTVAFDANGSDHHILAQRTVQQQQQTPASTKLEGLSPPGGPTTHSAGHSPRVGGGVKVSEPLAEPPSPRLSSVLKPSRKTRIPRLRNAGGSNLPAATSSPPTPASRLGGFSLRVGIKRSLEVSGNETAGTRCHRRPRASHLR